MAYKDIDGTICITVNDWLAAGLTNDMYWKDSGRGDLKIYRRGTNGNSLIDVNSIRRLDRREALRRVYGDSSHPGNYSHYRVVLSAQAQAYYVAYRKEDGSPLSPEQIESYTNQASLFEALQRGLETEIEANAKHGRRVKMGKWYRLALKFYNDHQETYPCSAITNPRSIERSFKRFLNGGYEALIHGLTGSDNARVVSVKMENLFLSLWRMHNKPFANRVHELYLEFVSGTKELYDTKTGESFRPQDFAHKGRALEVSEATVNHYLKDVINQTAVYADRNGQFDYMNKMRPKHARKVGWYSVSKISMDDVALSRQSVRGWVYKYIAVDVLSGYYFRPAYVVGKPSIQTVVEAFRNMFCELQELGLPMPGELEVENHLMRDIPFLQELFPFVRFCTSATEKRAEHAIRALKYGASKDAGHSNGRWYARHEAYKSVRNKVKGDYVADKEQPQTLVADDLNDIDTHNNNLHPRQKTFPNMTRKEVLVQCMNPNLEAIEPYYLYKYIGNSIDTTIYNNNHCPAANSEFELVDFNSLRRLQPNNRQVTAYWLPREDGSVGSVYLYQGNTYIGEATNRDEKRYNEFQCERTPEDEALIQHQNKRIASFDKLIRERRSELPKIGVLKATVAQAVKDVKVDLITTEQPKGYEADEFTDVNWEEYAINNL